MVHSLQITVCSQKIRGLVVDRKLNKLPACLANMKRRTGNGFLWPRADDREPTTFCSASDKPRVQASGDAGIGGAFDDGAAVGEQGHFVGFAPELQDKLVAAYGAVRL